MQVKGYISSSMSFNVHLTHAHLDYMHWTGYAQRHDTYPAYDPENKIRMHTWDLHRDETKHPEDGVHGVEDQ